MPKIFEQTAEVGLAKKSKTYPTEKELYDYVPDEFGGYTPVLNQDRLQKNVDDLVPAIIMSTACAIDTIYNYINNPGVSDIECWPPDPLNPAGDHPDDRFDVSDEFYWEKEFKLTESDLASLSLRTGVKKGKLGVWYKQQFMEAFLAGRAKYKDASPAGKSAIAVKFQGIMQKLEQRKNLMDGDWKGGPDIALFTNGFYNASISLMLKIGEPVRFLELEFNPDMVKDHPVLLVPTGGFYGTKNSNSIKAALDEYVKRGGTLVVLTQQHGYDWAMLPTPTSDTGERKPIGGYGYQEDQSCSFNSVYIDTYHSMLSGFSSPTANIGVDGYFTSYPENRTVLLRRTGNGQTVMIQPLCS